MRFSTVANTRIPLYFTLSVCVFNILVLIFLIETLANKEFIKTGFWRSIMTDIENSKDIEKELTRIFDRFNHHFWNDELPAVIITFKPTKGAHGHMTTAPVWLSDTAEDKYELNISAYTINRTPQEICETLLHEQVHLYCNIHKIENCTNNGRYHNANFKKVAEDHGLICKKMGYYGWADTELSDDALKYFKRLNIKQFAYHYVKPEPQKGTLKRYQCPECLKTVAWLSSEQNILCGDCYVPLVFSPTKKKG